MALFDFISFDTISLAVVATVLTYEAAAGKRAARRKVKAPRA